MRPLLTVRHAEELSCHYSPLNLPWQLWLVLSGNCLKVTKRTHIFDITGVLYDVHRECQICEKLVKTTTGDTSTVFSKQICGGEKLVILKQLILCSLLTYNLTCYLQCINSLNQGDVPPAEIGVNIRLS